MNSIHYNGLIYEDDSIKDASCYKSRSLTSDSLEIDTFSSDIVSETPLTQFSRNAPLVWYHRERQIGTFYVQTVTRINRNTYRLSATSAVGLLDQSDHYGGLYAGQTVAEVVADICTIPYAVKTSLQGIKLYGWLPIATRRANLAQVLFAIGATIKTDYNGVLRIEGLWDGVSDEIPEDDVFIGDSVEYASTVTHVIVTEHQYTTGGEADTLFDGTALSGDIVRFSEPMYDLVATGFSVLASGANYAKLSAGTGTLTGRKYIHTTRETTKEITQSDSPNTVTVEDATLVSLANSGAVADRLARYYAAAETIEHDVLYQSELPGDVAQLEHPYDDITITGCVESVDVDMSGKLRATERLLVGYTPPDIGESEYYDTSEIISNDGAWTVPDGVTSVRAVLIGGGDGGGKGEDGEPGALSTSTAAMDSWTATTDPGEGGKGGKGGSRGQGGNIYIADIDVSPGEDVSVLIGHGGSASGEGGDTTLATSTIMATSASGSRNATGYTDVISGQTYATEGFSDGTNGGSGGDGGAYDGAGNAGYPAGDNDGGLGGVKGSGYSKTDTTGGVTYRAYVYTGGGGGGGAATGTSGQAGSDGYAARYGDSGNPLSKGYSGHPGTGGNGATPAVPATPAVFGTGGHGGHGGGGGGGTGAIAWSRFTTNGTSYPSNGYTLGETSVGGEGGQGGDGAPGCVILYYRVPKPSASGQFLTRDGPALLDRHDRKMVV